MGTNIRMRLAPGTNRQACSAPESDEFSSSWSLVPWSCSLGIFMSVGGTKQGSPTATTRYRPRLILTRSFSKTHSWVYSKSRYRRPAGPYRCITTLGPNFFLDWDTGGGTPPIRYRGSDGSVRDTPSAEEPAHSGTWHVQRDESRANARH
jgi:hypothetical protein